MFSLIFRAIYMNPETFKAMTEAILELNMRLHKAEMALAETKVEVHALHSELSLAQHDLKNVEFAYRLMGEASKQRQI